MNDKHVTCYAINSFHSNAMGSVNPYTAIYETEVSKTLDLRCGHPTCNQGGYSS